jgi:hypothetical protein
MLPPQGEIHPQCYVAGTRLLPKNMHSSFRPMPFWESLCKWLRVGSTRGASRGGVQAEFCLEGCKILRLAGALLPMPDQERALTELGESQGAFRISGGMRTRQAREIGEGGLASRNFRPLSKSRARQPIAPGVASAGADCQPRSKSETTLRTSPNLLIFRRRFE